MVHPEALDGGQLDLTKQEFLVSSNFSIDKSNRLNQSISPKTVIATASTLNNEYGGEDTGKVKMTR